MTPMLLPRGRSVSERCVPSPQPADRRSYDAVSPLPSREPRRASFLRRVRGTVGPALLVLWILERARGKILWWLWHASDRSASPPGAASTCPTVLHAWLSGRKDPHCEERPRRGAQAGHRAVRRSERVYGTAGWP